MNPSAILTAAETRAAEQRLFDTGTAPDALMEQAGVAVAEMVAARFAGRSVLVACGPGNNGGDGYVIARALAEQGFAVRVAALGEPRTPSARAMRARWTGPVEAVAGAPARVDVLVDALFGSGSLRPLDAGVAAWIRSLRAGATVAVDLPSGVVTDTGAVPGSHVRADLTVALGAWKPAHVLAPAAVACGETVLAPIGLAMPAAPALIRVTGPRLIGPDAASNKYTRGKVVVIGGAMAGAAHLAALGAQRAGAGYVELVLDRAEAAPPYAIVRRPWSEAVLADPRISAVVIGPGLGEGDREKLEAALAVARPLVLDAGALALLRRLGLGRLRDAEAPRVLIPHLGEFERLFGPVGDDALAAVRAAAAKAGAIVLLKGATTIIATPDGDAAVAPIASPWLASAGTGDVLAGILGTMLAQIGRYPFAAVRAGVWLHARAAALAGPALIADDLPVHLPTALAECL